MFIQTERIWLFETKVLDPYFFGTIDGVTTTMSEERRISLLGIETVIFYISTIGRGGVRYVNRYGGEDVGMFEANGKISNSYTLEFGLPVISQRTIQQMIGKEFSLLAMRKDLTRFVIFGRFIAEPLEVDNEKLQRVTFISNTPNCRIFEVNEVYITTIVNTISPSEISGDVGGLEEIIESGLT